jgi:hypothetical protein
MVAAKLRPYPIAHDQPLRLHLLLAKPRWRFHKFEQ